MNKRTFVIEKEFENCIYININENIQEYEAEKNRKFIIMFLENTCFNVTVCSLKIYDLATEKQIFHKCTSDVESTLEEFNRIYKMKNYEELEKIYIK